MYGKPPVAPVTDSYQIIYHDLLPAGHKTLPNRPTLPFDMSPKIFKRVYPEMGKRTVSDFFHSWSEQEEEMIVHCVYYSAKKFITRWRHLFTSPYSLLLYSWIPSVVTFCYDSHDLFTFIYSVASFPVLLLLLCWFGFG